MDKKFVCIVVDEEMLCAESVYINKMPSIYDIFDINHQRCVPDISFPDISGSPDGVIFLDIIKSIYTPSGKEEPPNGFRYAGVMFNDVFLVCAIINDGVVEEATLTKVEFRDVIGESLDLRHIHIGEISTCEVQKKLLESIYTKWLVKPLTFEQQLDAIEDSIDISEEEKKELLS